MSTHRDYIEVIQNDYGYDIEGIILDGDDQAVDLTGFELKVIVAEEGSSTPKFEVTATKKVPFTSGEWYFTVLTGHFDVARKLYNLEIELSRVAPATIITARGAEIYVLPEEPET